MTPGRMKRLRAHWLITACLFCSCDVKTTPEEKPANCAIGQLSGTWRYHYVERQAGTTAPPCGAKADEYGTNPGAAPSQPGCQVQTQSIAPNKCSANQSFTCLTLDQLQLGTQSWTVNMRQTADDRIEASAQLQISYPTGACQSAYDVTIEKTD